MIKKRILTHPSIATTEENWQSEVSLSKLGQCGKFVIDDTAGTIRLPKVVNINGLQDLSLFGSIKAESLPNITGHAGGLNIAKVDGAFSYDGTANGATGNVISLNVLKFDASLSSSTYQDNAPVQQEAVQYPYFIQVATGNEEQADITTEIQLNNPFSLLDYKWSEYELTNASWLLSDSAFHSGSTYVSVYDLLLRIYNGTETKEGVSVKLSTETYEDTDFVLNTAESTFRLPIKVKLASGNRAAGNGMTLGLTDGTNNIGLWNLTVSPSRLTGTNNQYGTDIGTSATQGTFAKDNVSVGITTDPTKSGIETSSQDLYLYFYVGETVQDANIIAASNVLTNAVMKNSPVDRTAVVGWGMPDYTAGVSIPEFTYNNTTNVDFFTAPTDGILTLACRYNSAGTDNITINGNIINIFGATSDVTGAITLILNNGDKVGSYRNAGTGRLSHMVFYPCKGVK